MTNLKSVHGVVSTMWGIRKPYLQSQSQRDLELRSAIQIHYPQEERQSIGRRGSSLMIWRQPWSSWWHCCWRSWWLGLDCFLDRDGVYLIRVYLNLQLAMRSHGTFLITDRRRFVFCWLLKVASNPLADREEVATRLYYCIESTRKWEECFVHDVFQVPIIWIRIRWNEVPDTIRYSRGFVLSCFPSFGYQEVLLELRTYLFLPSYRRFLRESCKNFPLPYFSPNCLTDIQFGVQWGKFFTAFS